MTELICSTLCLACKAIFIAETPKNDSGEVSHHDLDALGQRATRGCHLCLIVYMSIDPEAFKTFRKDSTADSQGFAWLAPIARDQARLKFRYVRTTSKERERRTPSTVSSKMSQSSGERSNVIVVELIVMHPKCKFLSC